MDRYTKPIGGFPSLLGARTTTYEGQGAWLSGIHRSVILDVSRLVLTTIVDRSGVHTLCF